jgi:hypothetical protein
VPGGILSEDYGLSENEAKKASPDHPEADPEIVDEEDEDPTSKVI